MLDKELLIIGTMHEVPGIVSHSYRPLLQYAKRYGPEAIFTEDIRPDDTLSLKNFTPRFLHLADSLSRVNIVDEERFQDLRTKQLSDMDSSDFAFLSDAYLQKRDRANYAYYDYLKTYGTAGAEKPTRRENGDLIFPLAVSMGITELLPVDDHQTEPEYQRAWDSAMRAIQNSDDEQILLKLLKKDTRGSGQDFGAGWGIIPTNRQRSIDSMKSTPADLLPSLTNTAKPSGSYGMAGTCG